MPKKRAQIVVPIGFSVRPAHVGGMEEVRNRRRAANHRINLIGLSPGSYGRAFVGEHIEWKSGRRGREAARHT
jgi:hypothetical protein